LCSLPSSNLIVVQPLQRSEMQSSYAQDLGVESTGEHGLYVRSLAPAIELLAHLPLRAPLSTAAVISWVASVSCPAARAQTRSARAFPSASATAPTEPHAGSAKEASVLFRGASHDAD
jgi:hypothetical protein